MELQQINNDKDILLHNDGKILNVPDLIPITHEFADQIYLRKMVLKKGIVVVGAKHNHKHIWFLLSGKVTIKENNEIITHIAPCYTISKPGAQRIIHADEDSIFVNIHKNPTNTTNIEDLEKEIVSFDFEIFKT
jgi:quercetin dioxygenase-like cupin family protein